MFDIGFLELLVLAVIALLVIGPERLPKAVKSISGWLARSRHFANSLRDELEREANLDEIRQQLKQQTAQVKEQMEVLEKEKQALLFDAERPSQKSELKSDE